MFINIDLGLKFYFTLKIHKYSQDLLAYVEMEGEIHE
jgi:hypothetical protein